MTPDRDRPPTSVPPVEIPGLESLLTLCVGVVVVAALYFGRDVLVPITLAVLLSFVLAPLVNLLRRLRLPRVPAVLLSVVVALGIILAISGAIGTQIAGLVNDVPRYQDTVERKIETLRSMTLAPFAALMRTVGGTFSREQQVPAPSTAPGQANQKPSAPAPIPVEVHQPSPSPIEMAQRLLTPVLGPLGTTAIVFIVAVFVLLQREDLRDRLIRVFGSGDLHRTTLAMNDAAARLSRYFLTQVAINVGFGVVIGLGLLIIGVPSPPLWGIIATLLRFLPYIGAPMAAALPVALAAAVDPGWSMAIWTAALFLCAEAFTGQVIEPMLYGRSTGLSPVSVVISATFWTWLWGPIGLILSTPLTLCLVVLGRHVKRLEFLDVLLGDRPALTPIESFYQRMLAGDADEMVEQAEQQLRLRSLSSYYDCVVIPGLQMGATDRVRGVLTARQLERMRGALDSLMSDMDTHADEDPKDLPAEPPPASPTQSERALPAHPRPVARSAAHDRLTPPWSEDGAVLCLAGRGPLDEVLAAMLAQLLAKHGLGARVLPYEAAGRPRIADLDLSRAAMVCLCYLDLETVPASLRYLVRRLRQRRPDVRLMVGVWPSVARPVSDQREREGLGVDVCVTSLRDAVDMCVEAAERDSAPPEAAARSPGQPALAV